MIAAKRLKSNSAKPKRRARSLNVKKMIFNGDLISGVTLLLNNTVTLIIRKPFNSAEYYSSINFSLYDLYRKTHNFKDYFECPKPGNDAQPTLKIKEGCDLLTGDEVLNKLRELAAPSSGNNNKFPFKALLLKDKLIDCIDMSTTDQTQK